MTSYLRRGVWSLALFVLCVAAGGVLIQPAHADAPLLSKRATLRVMPLGDSITAGIAANGAMVRDGGYRGTLGKLLEDAGYDVEFVGSRTDYSSAIENRAHEGWPGYVLRSFPADPGPGQLLGEVTQKAIARDDADVILLMAGTNDLMRHDRHVAGYTLAHIERSMDLLLAQILRERPTMHVIVAPVVASPTVSLLTLDHFNTDLNWLVAKYARRGYAISLASEMADAVPRDAGHFPDGIHPCGDGGYAAIAGVWLEAIERITD